MNRPSNSSRKASFGTNMARFLSSHSFTIGIVIFCCLLAATGSNKRMPSSSGHIRKLAATNEQHDLEASESVYFPQLVDENELVISYGNKFRGDYSQVKSKSAVKITKVGSKKQTSSSSVSTTTENAYLKYLTETYYSTRPEKTTPTSVKSEEETGKINEEGLSAQAATSVERQTVFSLPQGRKVPNHQQQSSFDPRRRPAVTRGSYSRAGKQHTGSSSKLPSLASIPYVEPVVYDFGESNSVILASSSSSDEDGQKDDGITGKDIKQDQQQFNYGTKEAYEPERNQQQKTNNQRPKQVFQLKTSYQPAQQPKSSTTRQNIARPTTVSTYNTENDSSSFQPQRVSYQQRQQPSRGSSQRKKLVSRRPVQAVTSVRSQQFAPVRQPVSSVPPSVVEALKNVYSGEQTESAEVRKLPPGGAASVDRAVIGPPRLLPPQRGLITEGYFSGDGPIPGEAGKDYPIYHEVPETTFKCSEQRYPGYYADVEAECQAFHICQLDGRANNFLCPNGTLFSQQYFICDWWYNVECDQSESFFSLNAVLYDENAYFGQLPSS